MGVALDRYVNNINFLYDALLKSSEDYIFIGNLKTNEFLLSANMAEDFAFPSTEVEDLVSKWTYKVHEKDRQRFVESMEALSIEHDVHDEEYQVMNSQGEFIWVHCRGKVYFDELTKEPLTFAGVIKNLEKNGNVDRVTGLYTTEKCREEIDYNLKQKQNKGGIMLFGIDDFTNINMLNSHSFGNLVLRKTVLDLQKMMPENALMYRFDGDQFVVTMLNSSKEDMDELFKTIQRYTNQVHCVQNLEYQFTISAGVVMFPDDGACWSDLIRCLTIVMKKSKENGKNQCTYYTNQMLETKLREQRLSQLMAQSIREQFNGFHLVFQPVNDAQTMGIIGAEALLRYQCKEYGLISPVEFIPILEANGQIVQVGKWVLEQAIAVCRKWVNYLPNFTMNINISARQPINDDLCNFIQDRLDYYDLDAGHIELELTESYLVVNEELVTKVLARLRAMRLRIAIDDFGTGYSSLGRLQQLATDVVKIDRIFIRAIREQTYNQKFVQAVVSLCHSAGMKVCIEGVETQEELQIVSSLYADTVQGFYVSKPIGEEMFFHKFIEIPFNSSLLSVNHDKESRRINLMNDQDLILMLMDATPLCFNLWNNKFENTACNYAAVELFGLRDEGEYLERFFELSPKYQPDGRISSEAAYEYITQAFEEGKSVFTWNHCKLNGEIIPAEITLIRLLYRAEFVVAGYTRDLRQQIEVEKSREEMTTLMQALVEATPLSMTIWNRNIEMIMSNERAFQLFSLENEEEFRIRFFELSPEKQSNGEDSDAMAKRKILETFDKGITSFNWMHRNLEGKLIPAEITLVRVSHCDDYLVAGFTRDLREQIRAEEEIRSMNRRLKSIFNVLPIGYIAINDQYQVTDCNPAILSMLGCVDSEQLANNMSQFYPPFQPDGSFSENKLRSKIKETFENKMTMFEWMFQTLENEPIPTEMTLILASTPNRNIISCFCQDLRDLKTMMDLNDRLKEMAYFDLLTGSSSRFAFIEQFEKRFHDLKPTDQFPLLLIDLDKFKDINDTYGHSAGDETLRRVVEVIKQHLPENSLIGRYGGDEFTVQPGMIEESALREILQQLIIDVKTTKMEFDEGNFSTTISIGVAYWTVGCKSSEQLIEWADKALYTAKNRGRNNFVFLSK